MGHIACFGSPLSSIASVSIRYQYYHVSTVRMRCRMIGTLCFSSLCVIYTRHDRRCETAGDYEIPPSNLTTSVFSSATVSDTSAVVPHLGGCATMHSSASAYRRCSRRKAKTSQKANERSILQHLAGGCRAVLQRDVYNSVLFCRTKRGKSQYQEDLTSRRLVATAASSSAEGSCTVCLFLSFMLAAAWWCMFV